MLPQIFLFLFSSLVFFYYPNLIEINQSNNPTEVTESDYKYKEYENLLNAYISSKIAPLYKYPDKSKEHLLGYLPKGSALIIVGFIENDEVNNAITPTWYKINFEDVDGWALSSDVSTGSFNHDLYLKQQPQPLLTDKFVLLANSSWVDIDLNEPGDRGSEIVDITEKTIRFSYTYSDLYLIKSITEINDKIYLLCEIISTTTPSVEHRLSKQIIIQFTDKKNEIFINNEKYFSYKF